jgi:DNA recombination protein RmuC
MNEALLLVILLGTALTAVLATVLLVRVSSAFQSTAKEVRDELRAGRDETGTAARALREEVASGLKSGMGTLSDTLTAVGTAQQTHLEGMTTELKELKSSNQSALDCIRTTLDFRVKALQESNEKKLDEMRQTVDEKLGATLEKRLGEAFKQVSERLEEVHKGLGEMQNLATGVGDLKRVLTNVKVRGTWAEVHVGAILEQILTPDQYAKNVRVKSESAERVEYAVRLPGPKEDPKACVWLPIDSKFPQEDYLRLQEAASRSDSDGVQAAAADLARAVRLAAKDIHDKYVNPPSTTDFAVMFLATEGLYAEVLRQPGFVEEIQYRYRIVLAGPTTLAAILSSLRMGFQTLAIQQRTAEVWNILAAAKTEFVKFADVLDKVKRQLHTASETLEQTSVRSRAIERQLRSVEQLPEAEASKVLALPAAGEDLEPVGAY